MDWQKCEEEHIKKVDIDNGKINSILKMCNIRLKLIRKIALNNDNAFMLTENYYEIIKELLTAILLKNGLKSDNHECLISFFKEKFPKYEYEIKTIHQLKYVRNKISYEGFFVEKDYIERNKLEFEHIIELLTGLIKKG